MGGVGVDVWGVCVPCPPSWHQPKADGYEFKSLTSRGDIDTAQHWQLN